ERCGGGLDCGGEHFGRDRRHWGRHADALADHPTVRIEQGELDPGAADIDGQSARTGHGAPPPLRMPSDDNPDRRSRPFVCLRSPRRIAAISAMILPAMAFRDFRYSWR